MADVFNSVGEEFTFFQLESDAILKEDSADAAEVVEKNGECGGPKKNVVDDNTAAKVSEWVRVAEAV